MRNQLIYSIERFSAALKAESRAIAFKLGLRPVQWDALVYLSRANRFSDNPLSVTEYLGLTKGTVSQSLMVLEKKGLITKEKDKKDNRVIHLRLTSEGNRLVATEYPPKMFDSLLKEQSNSVQAILSSAISQLLKEYQSLTETNEFEQCKDCSYLRSAEKGPRCSFYGEYLRYEELEQICREFCR